MFAKFLLGRMNSQISIFTYLLFLASTGGAPWFHFWLPASIGEIFRLVKVVLSKAFGAWAGAAHISDTKALKWSYFNLWANRCEPSPVVFSPQKSFLWPENCLGGTSGGPRARSGGEEWAIGLCHSMGVEVYSSEWWPYMRCNSAVLGRTTGSCSAVTCPEGSVFSKRPLWMSAVTTARW